MFKQYAILAIALILVPMAAGASAYATEVEIVEVSPTSKTWILDIQPGCDYADSDSLRAKLNYNNTAYQPFLQNPYEVLCMGGVDILSIEKVTVPLLRSVFPNDALVFGYGETQERDYRLYVSVTYGPEYYRTTDGNAKVELGYALASADRHIDIQHERVHLETCSAHLQGSNNYDVSTWTKIVSKPWCMENP